MSSAPRSALYFIVSALLATLVAAAALPAQVVPAPESWVAAVPAQRLRLKTLPAAEPASRLRVNRGANRILLPPGRSRLTVLAGPATNMMSFRIAGLTNPEIDLPQGATVVLTVVNVDDDMNHSLALSHGAPPFAVHPQAITSLTTPLLAPHAAAYDAAVLTVRGLHAGAGFYLCTVAGHARAGMFGRFVVLPSRSSR